MTPRRTTILFAIPALALVITLALATGSSRVLADGDPAPPSQTNGPIKKLKVTANYANQEKQVYRAMGGVTNPKVPVHWNRFYDYAQSSKMLQDIAKAHPHLAKLESLGKSYGKRDLWVMTVTNRKDGKPLADKPAMWIDGGLHANETQATEVVLYTAWYLAEMAAINPRIKQLLDERVFYLAPMINPDARDAHFYKANNTDWPRGGMRPVDDDGDGLFDEDPADDLDGDGHITILRVRDENGTHIPHPKFPRMMIEAPEGTKGTYRMVGVEGYDNDGDGKINEDYAGYYDPNRLFPWKWEPEYIQLGGYRYPLAVPEIRAFADFMMARPHIAGSQNYHNTGGLIVRGPAVASDRYDAADIRVHDTMAKLGERILPGYDYIVQSSSLYESYGETINWRYQMLGHLAFLNEVWGPFNYFGTKDAGYIMPKREIVHEFDKYLLFEDAFVDWKEIDHPQFGRVEVGGKKKNFGRQPPSFMLEEMCHRNMAFTLYHADQMPKVRVQSIDVEDLGDGLTQVTATIENERLIPTRLAVDVHRNISPPDVVSIRAAGVDNKKIHVAAALTSGSKWFAQTHDHPHHPADVELKTIGGNSTIYVRWLVEGEGPFEVSVKSTKGGRHSLRSK